MKNKIKNQLEFTPGSIADRAFKRSAVDHKIENRAKAVKAKQTYKKPEFVTPGGVADINLKAVLNKHKGDRKVEAKPELTRTGIIEKIENHLKKVSAEKDAKVKVTAKAKTVTPTHIAAKAVKKAIAAIRKNIR